jgi:peroxiredoxin
VTGKDLARGAGFLVLVAVAAFAGVWLGMEFRQGRQAAPPPAIESDLVPGAAFPAETVLDAAGAAHDTARLAAGGGVVMFLAADCGACGLMLESWRPQIAGGALAGVPVIGLTYDPPERLADYPAKGADFPVYRDAEQVFGREHGVIRVPTVIVVGRDGTIRDHWAGHREDVDFERIRQLATS